MKKIKLLSFIGAIVLSTSTVFAEDAIVSGGTEVGSAGSGANASTLYAPDAKESIVSLGAGTKFTVLRNVYIAPGEEFVGFSGGGEHITKGEYSATRCRLVINPSNENRFLKAGKTLTVKEIKVDTSSIPSAYTSSVYTSSRVNIFFRGNSAIERMDCAEYIRMIKPSVPTIGNVILHLMDDFKIEFAAPREL